MRDPVEGQQVVLAERVERDRAGDHQLVITLLVWERRSLEWQGCEQFCEGRGDPPRSVPQALVGEVHAERLEEVGDRRFHALVVHLRRIESSSCAR